MLDNHGFDLWSGAYDQAVKLSDENNEYPFAGYKKLMNAIYGTVMEQCPAKVLDVGIGTGTLATKLYEAGNDITGVDFSAEMLKLSGAKMPNAKLLQCDFSEGLPSELKDERFDFIISTYAIHHLDDRKKAEFIRGELLTHLKDGGAILIGDVGFTGRAELESCKNASGDSWDNDEIYFVVSEMEERLRGDCQLTYHSYSHCSGILEIRALEEH